jgi:hypothetical protein
VNFKILDLTLKQAKLYSGMKQILDTVCAENRSLTLKEEIEYDAMAIQSRELAAELESRRSFERKVNEHVLTLMQKNGNENQ